MIGHKVEVLTPRRQPSPFRRLVEIAVRELVVCTRLPARYGARTIYVSPGNALAFLKPGDAKFDPMLMWLVDKFVEPGSVAWDVGANGGVFSTVAATVAKTAVAFEPDPFNIAILQRTADANPDLDIRLAPVALSDRSGRTVLHIPKRGRSVASIDPIPMGSQSGGLRSSLDVRTMTADDCLSEYPWPSFVKCDVEGAEVMFLRGATRLLREVRPIIAMEVRRPTAGPVAEILGAAGYRMFTSDEHMRPLTDLADICDFVAIPEA